MATKINPELDNKPPTLKYVKKASQWCKTYFKDGVQKQEWYPTKESAELS